MDGMGMDKFDKKTKGFNQQHQKREEEFFKHL
jgi:hypothetical protein